MNTAGRLGETKRSFAQKHEESGTEIGRKFSDKFSIKLHECRFSDIRNLFRINQMHNVYYTNAFDAYL
jgi:hypothetical protein